jgi:hypothetical protein
MNSLPTHLITNLDSVQQLHTLREEAFDNRDSPAVASFELIRKAFENYFISFLNNQSIDKDEISKNIFLRSILENYSSGRKNIKLLQNVAEISKPDNSWQSSFLFQLTMDLASNFPEVNTDLTLKSIPKDWDRYFRLPKIKFTIGGIASDFKGWNNLGLDKLPINSLYIIDPYFLKDRKLAEINLPEIVKGLVGKRSNVKALELDLFVKHDLNDPKFQKTKEADYQKLNEILKNLYPNKNFVLSILYIPGSKMHDRYLFTNFYYLSSGKGFNVYNERKKLDQQKSNNLDIQLLAEPNAIKAILKRLSEVKNWIEGSTLNLEYSGTMPTKLLSVL